MLSCWPNHPSRWVMQFIQQFKCWLQCLLQILQDLQLSQAAMLIMPQWSYLCGKHWPLLMIQSFYFILSPIKSTINICQLDAIWSLSVHFYESATVESFYFSFFPPYMNRRLSMRPLILSFKSWLIVYAFSITWASVCHRKLILSRKYSSSLRITLAMWAHRCPILSYRLHRQTHLNGRPVLLPTLL